MTDTGFPRTTMPDTAQRAARGAENQAQGLSNTGGSTSQSVANELKVRCLLRKSHISYAMILTA
jgi:hypothetical protein